MKRALLTLLSPLLLVGAPALLAVALAETTPPPALAIDPAEVRFDGRRASALQRELATRFGDRASGRPNNRLAAEWIAERLRACGLQASIDAWDTVNYDEPLTLRNVVARRRGASGREVVLVAHHDQSPATVQGADNDASGVAIMLHIAETLPERPLAHDLVILSADAEEWGMLGARRYVRRHPDPRRIVAAVSLDNLGKRWADGVEMAAVGQLRGIGPIALQRHARVAAAACDGAWVPRIRGPLDQVLGQAVPVSFMDQGPFVAAGVPALGFTSTYPAADREHAWRTYHTPLDTMEHQSPEVLHRNGNAAAALVLQLMGAPSDALPRARGPHVALDPDGARVVGGWPLGLVFAGQVAAFLLAFGLALAAARRARDADPRWGPALAHVASLLVPIAVALLAVPLMVPAGLMTAWELYPATARDPAIFAPRWPAVLLFAAALAGMLALGRRVARRAGAGGASPRRREALCALVLAAASAWLGAVNPFSLLFVAPTFAWLFIRADRTGAARLLDAGLLLLGGAFLWLLVWFFGFVVLRNDFAIFWYLMMMFSTPMLGAGVRVLVAAVIAAGLSVVVSPPGARAGGSLTR